MLSTPINYVVNMEALFSPRLCRINSLGGGGPPLLG
jgi:hypothetical protein